MVAMDTAAITMERRFQPVLIVEHFFVLILSQCMRGLKKRNSQGYSVSDSLKLSIDLNLCIGGIMLLIITW